MVLHGKTEEDANDWCRYARGIRSWKGYGKRGHGERRWAYRDV